MVDFFSSGLKEIDLDLDGQGGRTFLRVLLYLCMHNYPPLVTGALQLLFRHFSQRQEVLQAFKQVDVTSTSYADVLFWGCHAIFPFSWSRNA